MKIRVDFFKPSGKWYAGGMVEVGDHKLWMGSLLDVIWKNQEILSSHPDRSPQTYWTIVIDDPPNTENDPSYNDFFKAVLQIGRDEEVDFAAHAEITMGK